MVDKIISLPVHSRAVGSSKKKSSLYISNNLLLSYVEWKVIPRNLLSINVTYTSHV